MQSPARAPAPDAAIATCPQFITQVPLTIEVHKRQARFVLDVKVLQAREPDSALKSIAGGSDCCER